MLDLKQAFYHFLLDKESSSLITVWTHVGLFRYKRLPMGMKDAGSVCQCMIEKCLAGCTGGIAYMNDILVHGADHGKHDKNLKKVLTVFFTRERLPAQHIQMSIQCT